MRVVRDSSGNVLADGDSVFVIKDLPVKGASSALKAGTKVKGIMLVEGDHNIDGKVEGFGGMRLKSEFVKKAWPCVCWAALGRTVQGDGMNIRSAASALDIQRLTFMT